ncbi:MAG: Pvc16 family protein [Litoreibacter sp.]|uniref:Pvc16 family protein n=1 Tax=Litoreibacter sp. TaxID=1969459 RepID=UPI0032992228
MALDASSLSIAIQGFADHLAASFTQDVTVTVGTPNIAADQAKGSDKAVLNVFCYRLSPSGIHPDLTPNEPTFIRAHVLLTAFSDATDAAIKDKDLRVLGHALRVLQSQPVIPTVLPGNSPAPQVSQYRIQAVLQATEMEEMNHIWSIQGSDTSYRLSVAYELALIPVEPLTYAPPPVPVQNAVLDLSADAKPDSKFSSTPIAITPANSNHSWLPFSMIRVADMLTSQTSVAPGTSQVQLAIAGQPDAEVAISVQWQRADETTQSQSPQNAVITSNALDLQTALIAVDLQNAASGDVATLVIRPVGADMPAGNTVGIEVT